MEVVKLHGKTYHVIGQKKGYEFLLDIRKDGNRVGLGKSWRLSHEALRIQIFIAARSGRSTMIASMFADGALRRIHKEEMHSRGHSTINIVLDDI